MFLNMLIALKDGMVIIRMFITKNSFLIIGIYKLLSFLKFTHDGIMLSIKVNFIHRDPKTIETNGVLNMN